MTKLLLGKTSLEKQKPKGIKELTKEVKELRGKKMFSDHGKGTSGAQIKANYGSVNICLTENIYYH